MMKLVRNFVRDEKGEDLIEYGLLAAFVAAIAVAIVVNGDLRTAISNAFASVVSALNLAHASS